ncbi:putative sulfate exporter family transporter [Subtercola vilae]|uniref:Putative sulfate exporter family transporter n=2 Tax=Subtercola vilae TaxID=2056433 RepID=A0A4T2C1Z0_9MICO|nr:putative sulfate exporter family transporter [Subtercola sp. RTI3]MEA9985586.1 putative sulfate exporter family transporter [Subtercola sp. RTI3]TIH36336.1 putative sulfate exporter family transporter [Subtercola vilae]
MAVEGGAGTGSTGGGSAGGSGSRLTPTWWPRWGAGVVVAGVAALVALGIHSLVPAVPLLTAAVGLGMIAGQIPASQRLLDTVLKPGIALAARRLLRIGIVLLGLKLSLFDIAGLGWPTIIVIVLIVGITFSATLGLGKLLRLPGTQPILIAAGFSICGASAVGAMSAVTRSKDEDQATPIALVTLCGTLAIFILPVLRLPLGLDEQQFGMWVGLSVHDVGQVVATAQIAGPAALAVAVVVKLTRVLTLAPMVAIVGLVERARDARELRAGAGNTAEIKRSGSGTSAKRPAIVPLFIAGFLAAVVVRTVVPLPGELLSVADMLQTALLAMALFALGSNIRFAALARTGWRALIVGLASWALIAVLSLGAVAILT